MKLFKKLAAALLAVSMVASLAACGTSGGSFSRKAYSFSPQDRNSATATSRAHSPVEVR